MFLSIFPFAYISSLFSCTVILSLFPFPPPISFLKFLYLVTSSFFPYFHSCHIFFFFHFSSFNFLLWSFHLYFLVLSSYFFSFVHLVFHFIHLQIGPIGRRKQIAGWGRGNCPHSPSSHSSLVEVLFWPMIFLLNWANPFYFISDCLSLVWQINL